MKGLWRNSNPSRGDSTLSNWKVPLADLDFGEAEIAAVTQVLRSRWLSMGPVTAEFERRFAAFTQVKHAFAVTNCTAALHLAHLALGAGIGDTVLCPSLTFVATANAIRHTGAVPVFVDITSTTDLNLAPDDVEAKIDASTKGICVLHYGGYPCDMEWIMEIARRHNLYVVEDAAHAPGATTWVTDAAGTRLARQCGSIGDVGCFSFFANKNLATGEGGMLTTNNDAVAEKIRYLRSHGMTSLTWDREQGHSSSYDVVAHGYNYRMDEMRAALGLVQLEKLEHNNQRRAEATHYYQERLHELAEISVPFPEVSALSSYHLLPILLRNGGARQELMQFLRDKGIQTSMHYPPVHQFTHYRGGTAPGSLRLTDEVATRLMTLPLYPGLSTTQIDYVVAALKEWFARRGGCS
jgi:dTDP-4-amino-4,6-dideoxygalactose transaminase